MKQYKKQMDNNQEYYTDEIHVQYFPNKHGTYKANLFGPIVSPEQFSQIVTVLDIMSEEDELIINLSSGGGSLCAVDNLLHAMRKTSGSVHIIATGDVSSAATFVLLEGDSFELSEGFEATLHCGSLGYGGNFNEVSMSAPFQLKHMENYLRSAYEGFVTEEELHMLFKGLDILLDAKGWYERSLKRMEYFSKKHEAMEKEAQKASRPKRVKPKAVQSVTNPAA